MNKHLVNLKTLKLIAAGMIFMSMALGSNVQARDFEPPTPGQENEVPKQLEGVGITEHLGEKVNLSLKFKNEKGETVTLGDYLKEGKPVLLSLAYYTCPSLCNFHLNGLLEAFKGMKDPVGKDFNFVVVSIEPKETPELASKKLANYLKSYHRPEGEAGWHFLTGDQAAIQELAKDVGFKYHWDDAQKQWAHTSAAYVLTPSGQISRYLYGIMFDPKTIRLSMVEASGGRIATVVDRLVLYCFHFDAKASKYSLAAFNVARAGGVAVLMILAAFMIPFWIRNRREEKGEV